MATLPLRLRQKARIEPPPKVRQLPIFFGLKTDIYPRRPYQTAVKGRFTRLVNAIRFRLIDDADQYYGDITSISWRDVYARRRTETN
jgi:hypothetical protein